MSDAVDSALVLLAADGGEIITIETGDIKTLAASAGRHIELPLP